MKRFISIILGLTLCATMSARIPDETFFGEENFETRTIDSNTPALFLCETDNIAMQVFEFGFDGAGRSASEWSVLLYSPTDTLTVSCRSDRFDIDGTIDPFASCYSISRNDIPVSDHKLKVDKGLDNQPEFIRIVVSADCVMVYGGRGTISTLKGLSPTNFYDTAIVMSKSSGKLIRTTMLYKPAQSLPRRVFITSDEMMDLKRKSSDENVCIWTFYDEDYDDEIAALAGKYRLFLMPDDNSGYYILYVDGIKHNSIWKTGMLKGHLAPTSIAGSYNLKWYDLDGRLMNENISATLENGLLTLDFPYEKARFRFIRE